MRIEVVELRVVALPLVQPFVAAHGTVGERTAVLVRIAGPDGEGWADCAALPAPTYTEEFVEGAVVALRDHLVPRLLDAAADGPGGVAAADLARVLGGVVGHPMAKAALELALLDAEGRRDGITLAERLAGGTPVPAVPAGLAIGLQPDPKAVDRRVAEAVAAGYGRVKLKIAPGADVDHLRAARAAGGPSLVLVADANAAYRWDAPPGEAHDARRLTELDDLGLACLEQPLPADDLLDHAELARRLATPICLDESLTTPLRTYEALDSGACSVVCVKAPRYGSWLAAADVLDHCRAGGVDAWVGGMLHTALGRAADLALAAHPGATLPGDISLASSTFLDDVGPAPAPLDGRRPLAFEPLGPGGLGTAPDPEALGRLTRRTEILRRP